MSVLKNFENEIKELEKSLDDENSSTSLLDIIDDSLFSKFLDNKIIFTPFIGRVQRIKNEDKKNYKKREKDIFNSITNFEFRENKRNIINNLLKKNNIDNRLFIIKFNKFKKKYKHINQNEDKIIQKAMQIKYDDENYLTDICSFLLENGIILLIEQEEIKYLDGFSCFYNECPIIWVYEKKEKNDKRRMLFTIMHELYHLMYDENESLADAFAGAALLTIKDIKSACPDVVNKKTYIEENYPKSIESICLKNNISVTAATKTLMKYKYLLNKEDYYYNNNEFQKIRENIEKKLEEKSSKILIKSTYDSL